MLKFTKISLSLISLLVVMNVTSAQKKGEYKLIDIPSPSLENCLINPKKTQKVGIYLPPSYNESTKRYPVVYNLTGYTVQPGQYPPTGWIDSIMVNKLVQEMIFVEISGYNMFKGTMYTNSPVTGNWEDFVTKDVIDYIDKNYRTLAKRESRGIAGHSMGGGGTFNISLKHADLYSVAYPMSPAIAPHDSLMLQMFGGSNGGAIQALQPLAQAMKNVPDDKFEKKLTEVLKQFNGQMDWVIGYGAAFAPDMSQPLRMVLPFDVSANNKLTKNEKNWKLWEQGFGNIDEKVKKYKKNLLRYKHYSFDCGFDDEVKWIYEGTKYLHNLLTINKIPHSLHFYNGTHTSKVGEQMANRLMPIMSTYLEKE